VKKFGSTLVFILDKEIQVSYINIQSLTLKLESDVQIDIRKTLGPIF
jgi:hypothetical protein